MKTNYSLVLAALLTTASIPAMASAVLHDGPAEAAYTVNPDHVPGAASRGQVQQELDTARADKRGPYYRFQYSTPQAPMPAVVGKLREQVQREADASTPAQRQRQNQLYSGA